MVGKDKTVQEKKFKFVDIGCDEIVIDSHTVFVSTDIKRYLSFIQDNFEGIYVYVTKQGFLYTFTDDRYCFLYSGKELKDWRREHENL